MFVDFINIICIIFHLTQNIYCHIFEDMQHAQVIKFLDPCFVYCTVSTLFSKSFVGVISFPLNVIIPKGGGGIPKGSKFVIWCV